MILLPLGEVALHAVVPFELSRRRDRVEGRGRSLPAARSAGLLMVAAGATLMAWAFATHYAAAPRGWTLEPEQEYLLRTGPYRLSRNPMYAGEAVVWFGWGLFYGRPAVWAGLAILCGVRATIVSWEERRLLDRFGDDYRDYVAEVPRWAARVRWAPGR